MKKYKHPKFAQCILAFFLMFSSCQAAVLPGTVHAYAEEETIDPEQQDPAGEAEDNPEDQEEKSSENGAAASEDETDGNDNKQDSSDASGNTPGGVKVPSEEKKDDSSDNDEGTEKEITDSSETKEPDKEEPEETGEETDHPDENVNAQEISGADLLMMPLKTPADNTSTGGFTVAGGTYGVDYEYGPVTVQIQGYGYMEDWSNTYGKPGSPLTDSLLANRKSGGVINVPAYNTLFVKTSTPLTITTNGSTVSDCITVEPGVHADLTFNNVNINGRIPVNLKTNSTGTGKASNPDDPLAYIKDRNATSLHLTLADGSNNTLTALTNSTTYEFPAIRCGEGAKLTIDDARRNIDQNGSPVLPDQGRISRNAVLADGTVVKQGERLTKLDSINPGKLTANGSYRASAIGGAAMESSGEITFDGGIITAKAYGAYDGTWGAGAGIGGGHAGGGTTLTFNGGSVDSYGSLHGAGIGGGCTYVGGMSSSIVTYALTDSIINCYALHTVAGNININGGYIQAHGYRHGNAFGQGCGGTLTDKKITVTGGTLLPTTAGADWKTYDIGGQGGDVIITGGSIRTAADGNKYQSRSGDGSAWGNLEMTRKVYMRTINLAGYNVPNTLVNNLDMTVAGEELNYGLPSYTDENGKLYFWLPLNGKVEVRVDLGIIDKTDPTGSKIIPMDSFYITAEQPGNTLKQYAHFDIDTSKLSETDKLYKKYDGTPFTSRNLLDSITGEGGIPVDYPTGGKLNDPQKMSVQSQLVQVDEKTNEPISEGGIVAGMPAGAGTYQLLITSTQYATDPSFSGSFWGHRGTYRYAQITPAESFASTEYSRAGSSADSTEKITFHTIVRPADGEASTCASPEGKVEYYVVLDDDSIVKIAEADLSSAKNGNTFKTIKGSSSTTDYFYSEANAEWTPVSGVRYKRNKDNQYKIRTKYIPSADITVHASVPNYNTSETETENFTITPIAQDFSVAEKSLTSSSDETTIIKKKENSAERSFQFGDHGETGENATIQLVSVPDPDGASSFIYSSSDDSIAEIDKDGKITFHKDGKATFTILKSGDGASDEKKKTVTYTVCPKNTDYDKLTVAKTAKRSRSGPIQSGEMITYKIAVTNNVPGSVIDPVVIRDHFPEGLSLATSAITIRNPNGESQNIANSKVYEAETRDLTVDLGKLSYGQSYVITIRTIVDALTYEDEEGNVKRYDFGNTVYYGPGKNDQEKQEFPNHYGPVYPDESVESETGKDPVHISKSASLVDDATLQYTLRVWNSDIYAWNDVAIRDVLPEEVSLVPGSMKITEPGQAEKNLDAEYYNAETRTIYYSIGILKAEESYSISFQCNVNEDVGADKIAGIANIGTALVGKDTEINTSAVIPGHIEEASGDPSDQPLRIEKGCEVEDGALVYTMRVENRDIVPWFDVVFRDVLPEEVTLQEDTLTLTAPGQKAVKLDQSKYYNPDNRTIDYPIGTLNPGEVYLISFACNASEEELAEKNETTQDIENVGTLITGTGQIDTPGVHPGETKGAAGDPSGISLSKRADYNAARPNEITYTLVLQNASGEDSSDAVITDALPDPLTLKPGSVQLAGPEGTKSLSDSSVYSSENRKVACNIGTLKNGETYVLTFTALIISDGTKSVETQADVENELIKMHISGVKKISDIRNSGSAGGSWGGSPWGIDTGGVGPGGNGSGNTNSTNSEDDPDMYITKTAENRTHGSGELHVNDIIGYTIEAGNDAAGNKESAVNHNTVLTEYLPIGLNVNFESMQLIVPDGKAQKSISPLTRVDTLGTETGTYTYAENQTIIRNNKNVSVNIMKVYVGDLRPQEKAYLYFTGKVTDKVTDIGNSAGLGDDDPIDPVYPGVQKKPDPPEEVPVVEKNAKPVRKAIEYSVHIKNPTRRSTWRNVQLFDYLPPQLEIVQNSIKIQKYENGRKTGEFAPDAGIYNESTNILTYPIAKLRPKEEYVMKYQAVAKGSGDKPIENKAGYTGEDPNGKITTGNDLSVLPVVPDTGDDLHAGHWLEGFIASVCATCAAAYMLRKH